MMDCHVTHLITDLSKGGAETMLYQILKYKTDASLICEVISLSEGGYYESKIRALGIPVCALPLRKHPVASFYQLLRRLRKTDVLFCWMYHANFIGYLSGRMMRVKRIVWNIRHSDLSKERNKNTTLCINRWCAKWSHKVDVVAYNGNKARQVHEGIGYCSGNGIVLKNGVDIEEYRCIDDARELVFSELNLTEPQRIVLSVTRNHPIKDIPTFIRAFSKAHAAMPEIVAVMCGNGVNTESEAVVAECEKAGLLIGKDIFLLGMRQDVPKLLSACDLYVLHSAGEAFPNTLVQAMACGCLCLTTDVGDACQILSNDLCVVPPGDPRELCCKIEELLVLPPEQSSDIRRKNRARAQEQYNIQQVVKGYEGLMVSL